MFSKEGLHIDLRRSCKICFPSDRNAIMRLLIPPTHQLFQTGGFSNEISVLSGFLKQTLSRHITYDQRNKIKFLHSKAQTNCQLVNYVKYFFRAFGRSKFITLSN